MHLFVLGNKPMYLFLCSATSHVLLLQATNNKGYSNIFFTDSKNLMTYQALYFHQHQLKINSKSRKAQGRKAKKPRKQDKQPVIRLQKQFLRCSHVKIVI